MPPELCARIQRFVSGDGTTFYFHGKKDQDFRLVFDSNPPINGHFIGKRNENMSLDITWVQCVGAEVRSLASVVAHGV